MLDLVRSSVRNLKPYTPGEQPSADRKVIKLNTNENPYPPSRRVMAALRRISADRLRRYPQPLADSFRKAASEVFGLPEDMIIAGNGSDELLTIIIRTFVERHERIAYPWPTYSLYPVLAAIEGAECVEVGLNEDYSVPFKKLSEVKAKLFFIANPNAPTGILAPRQEIRSLLDAVGLRSIVVIDEAYVDFAEDNCLELVKSYSNLIVLRTLSKGYSLAGIRFGFAFASQDIINELLKVKDSYNCDAISIELATEAIKDQEYLKETVQKVKAQREWLTERLRRLGFRVLDSSSNFLWVITEGLIDAARLYYTLKQRGILVRYFDKEGMRDGVRITVGRPSENRTLIKVIEDILKEPGR